MIYHEYRDIFHEAPSPTEQESHQSSHPIPVSESPSNPPNFSTGDGADGTAEAAQPRLVTAESEILTGFAPDAGRFPSPSRAPVSAPSEVSPSHDMLPSVPFETLSAVPPRHNSVSPAPPGGSASSVPGSRSLFLSRASSPPAVRDALPSPQPPPVIPQSPSAVPPRPPPSPPLPQAKQSASRGDASSSVSSDHDISVMSFKNCSPPQERRNTSFRASSSSNSSEIKSPSNLVQSWVKSKSNSQLEDLEQLRGMEHRPGIQSSEKSRMMENFRSKAQKLARSASKLTSRLSQDLTKYIPHEPDGQAPSNCCLIIYNFLGLTLSMMLAVLSFISLMDPVKFRYKPTDSAVQLGIWIGATGLFITNLVLRTTAWREQLIEHWARCLQYPFGRGLLEIGLGVATVEQNLPPTLCQMCGAAMIVLGMCGLIISCCGSHTGQKTNGLSQQMTALGVPFVKEPSQEHNSPLLTDQYSKVDVARVDRMSAHNQSLQPDSPAFSFDGDSNADQG